jgi:heavy metal sensor kinase
VAQTAEMISGRNLSVRISSRDAGDELDVLIDAFNRMIARLETSFEQIRRFSTDVSHELRTPITVIRGQLEVALMTANTEEELRTAIMNVLQDVERLSKIVRALLLLSQSETGQLTLKTESLDLAALLRDLVIQFEIPAAEAGVRIRADLPAQCIGDVDKVQFDRMVSNLLSNAIRYTPAGGEVQLRLKNHGDYNEITVEDTGCGIPPEHLPHIFERFYRVPSQDPHFEKGLGLGLSFVSLIVKVHGGSVHVDSKLEEGTRFTVRLPAVSAGPSLDEPTTLSAGETVGSIRT